MHGDFVATCQQFFEQKLVDRFALLWRAHTVVIDRLRKEPQYLVNFILVRVRAQTLNGGPPQAHQYINLLLFQFIAVGAKLLGEKGDGRL